ncbi:hypothetical protein DES38_1027 [Streptohalobacillus salinus]|uniref:Cellobiose phosphorylase n=1 Tax=Streptohalobacillus salinus TaxID=621096 RepID=A0A2V3WFB7_9BACI|nr:hypothetical protein [Streptohalobacillus salinus]PXW92429.1 hypothetical protein DES38_1027 [Streptohalobacillus salinus]
MNTRDDLYFGNTFLYQKTKAVSLKLEQLKEGAYFKIENFDEMPPFFMTIVSDSDQWMFISSTGGLTSGRKNAESALFPYDTDDKIHDSHETTGPDTQLIIKKNMKSYLWQPFSTHMQNVYQITRNLYKNTTGNKIIFEEINHDLDVSYRYIWKTSDQFGFVKESKLENLAEQAIEVRVLDGLRNILPYGVNTLLQTTKSTLVDGYKRSELVEGLGLGIYTLSSILTDKAEPSESLKATTVWSTGLDNPQYLLSEQQTKAFWKNGLIETEVDVKGRRGAYYVEATVTLDGKTSKHWSIVAELNQSVAAIEALLQTLKETPDMLTCIEADVSKGEQNLKRMVYQADGVQYTADKKATYRHFSNTLYNIMRGGIYASGYMIDRKDFASFVANWNKAVYAEQQICITQLPETISYAQLLTVAAETQSRDFERLVYEYLPLTFSRRHGDPSRPWNKFNIELTKEDGSKALKFEGNWRDIFQNWEALSISYPNYIESIIAKFVNASTADGYNPYRITKDGIDWEKIDPEDPWSNIGYWGDHQIIYLLKLLELSKAYHPEKLQTLLQKEIYAYAHVPYKIKGFAALVNDPRNSIEYDDQKEQAIEQKIAEVGADGKLVYSKGKVYQVNLMEKLLVTLLAKFSNYVPEGGIWMNTQRPEWNDANNALVGNGLSMVTLYYMHRFQDYMSELIETVDATSINVSVEVMQMFKETYNVLADSKKYLGENMSDSVRFEVVKALGEIGERYRHTIYTDGFSGKKAPLEIQSLRDFTDVSMNHLKDSITKNKRTDGLYHAYNLIRFEEKRCSISHLYEMLEGQVAVLSSKALTGKEAIAVLIAIRKSAIYREDQHSYMLYPNRELPTFLTKNIIPEEYVKRSFILKEELNQNQTRFIEQDVKGNYHFNGQFRNGEEIRDALITSTDYQAEDIKVVEEVFSDLFNHHAFTGRSGTFYKYEGLGSVYWHMVSKLLLATQENFEAVYQETGMNEEAETLLHLYEDIKAGIGLEKSPEAYGAFPTEAYSHTPSFAGVQQPGMTGQVKEDFISRFGELGVHVTNGQIQFNPVLLAEQEFLTGNHQWSLPTKDDTTAAQTIELKNDMLGFTFCTVPITYCLDTDKKLVITFKDGTEIVNDHADTLTKEISQRIFNRDGEIAEIKVHVKRRQLNRTSAN